MSESSQIVATLVPQANPEPTSNLPVLEHNMVNPSQNASPEESEVVETQQEEPKVEQDTKVSARFAALARKEKALQEREKAYKEQEAKYKELASAIEEVKSNPLKALESLGMSFEDFAQAYVNALDPQAPSAEDKIAQIEAKLAAKEKEELDRQERAKQEALKAEQKKIEDQINNYKQHIQKTISADDRYELIQANQAYETVFDVIQDYYKETGKVLELDKAAQAVESHFEEEAKRLLSLKKFKLSTTNESVMDKVSEARNSDVGANASRTLNNQVTLPTVSENKGLSAEESLRRAASLLKWNK